MLTRGCQTRPCKQPDGLKCSSQTLAHQQETVKVTVLTYAAHSTTHPPITEQGTQCKPLGLDPSNGTYNISLQSWMSSELH